MRSLLPTITERAIHPDTLNPHTPRQQPNGYPSVKGIQHETSLYNIRTTHTGESTYPPTIQPNQPQRQKAQDYTRSDTANPPNQNQLRGLL